MGANSSKTQGRRAGFLSFVPRSKNSTTPKDSESVVSSVKGKKNKKGTPSSRSQIPSSGQESVSGGQSARSNKDCKNKDSKPVSIEKAVAEAEAAAEKQSAGAPSPTSPQTNINRSNFILAKTGDLLDNYEVESQQLGQGTYGSVCMGKSKSTGQIRAIKTISKAQLHNIDRFRQEISIMKSLDHPNIVKLFETFEDQKNIYLVMELCQGGELFDRIIEEGHFTEKDAAVLMKQILSAVHYLHTNLVMHRDLKPENFLFLSKDRDSSLKIIDFGLSCRFTKPGDIASTKAGTPYYVAPQVLQGSYDEKCDEWSAGVILYILLCGYPPFYGETDSEVLSKVRSGRYSFSGSEWRRVSDESKDLIRNLLKMSTEERISAEKALGHSFIVNMAKVTGSVALPITLMSNLRGFRAQNKLKKVALTVIAQHMSDTDIDNLRKIFTTLDQDNSGTLTVSEVTEGLKKLGWHDMPPDLQQIMQEVDSDGSGVIDYTEFIAATMDRKVYMKQDICKTAFEIFDLDGNGRISQDELRQILGMPNVEDAVGKETIEALLNEVDLDGDGQIDFDEFMIMMQKRHPEKRSKDSRRSDLGARH